MKGFCAECKTFSHDPQEAFGRCPRCTRSKLLHRHVCQTCPAELYFQIDDDYCGPDNDILCGDCCRKMEKA